MNSSDYFRRNRMTPSTNYSYAVSVDDSLSDSSLNFKANEDNCRTGSSNHKEEAYHRLLLQSQILIKKLNSKITSVNTRWKKSYNDKTNLSMLKSQMADKSEALKRRIADKQDELQSLREKHNVFNVMKIKLEQSKLMVDSSQVKLAESNLFIKDKLQNVYLIQNDLERIFIDNNYLNEEKEKLKESREEIQKRIESKEHLINRKKLELQNYSDKIKSLRFKPRHQHRIQELDELKSVLDTKYAEICHELSQTNLKISEMQNQIDHLQY